MRLYHYCCSCSARRITARGFLRPHGRAQFGVDLVWLTDQAIPNRQGLGLTSTILRCDRLEHQYVIDCEDSQVVRWLDSPIRKELSREVGFEAFEDGRQPETWWIATKPIFAIRSLAYERKRA